METIYKIIEYCRLDWGTGILYILLVFICVVAFSEAFRKS